MFSTDLIGGQLRNFPCRNAVSAPLKTNNNIHCHSCHQTLAWARVVSGFHAEEPTEGTNSYLGPRFNFAPQFQARHRPSGGIRESPRPTGPRLQWAAAKEMIGGSFLALRNFWGSRRYHGRKICTFRPEIKWILPKFWKKNLRGAAS